ncbi:MAG: DUF4238 domain-containing protein [Candidatus Binatia bacterium]
MKQTQHYVPQFMLRRFALKRRKRHRSVHQVWVKDLTAQRAYIAAVPHVAAETGFYRPRAGGPDADWLEAQLGKIEDLAAPAIARLADSSNWQAHTDEDRVTLAIFLIRLYTRGPRVRRNLAEMARQVLEHFKAIGETTAPELQRELEAVQASDPVPDHAGVIMETAKNYPALVERSWWLLVPPIGSRFISSDCPVLMENPILAGLKSNMGLLVTGVIVYLPLSPYLMLMVADSIHGLPDRRVHHIGAQEFRNLRWLTGFCTERFIYGRSPDDLFVPEGSWVGGRRPQIVSPVLKSKG